VFSPATAAGSWVLFHNDTCLRCPAPLGCDHDRMSMVALIDLGHGALVAMTGTAMSWQRYGNAAVVRCNRLVATDPPCSLDIHCLAPGALLPRAMRPACRSRGRSPALWVGHADVRRN
jgi:hypothetical protein